MLRLVLWLAKGNSDEKTEHYHALRFRYSRGRRNDSGGLTDLAGGLSYGGVSRFRRSGPAASLNLYDED